MNDKKTFFNFAIIFFSLFTPSLTAGNKFDGVYKSEFLLGVNRSYYIDDKCPSKLPISVKLIVDGNNITGNITNNLSNSTQCSNYQKGQIKGEIDDSGNIVKIKFDHDTKSGQKEDAYAIEGNLNGELILKSKLRALYRRDAKFFFTRQSLTNINDEYINERETNYFKNENEFSDESQKQPTEELKEKQLRELQEKQLRELQEKQLRDEQDKQVIEQQQKQLKEQKRIKKESNLLFN